MQCLPKESAAENETSTLLLFHSRRSCTARPINGLKQEQEKFVGMIEIDGSQGEGGGQIVRSSLALSAVTGRPIKLTKIRAGRSKPGLLRQHLTALQAAVEICQGKAHGAQIGSTSVTFEPGTIRSGDFEFQVGTAGSTSLVAQTVLPALMSATGPSTLTLDGGTHNPWAPPFDFLQRAFLPQLAKMGPQVSGELDSYGFYPAGGGRVRFTIIPSQKLKSLTLEQPAQKWIPTVTAVVSNIPSSIGKRECDVVRRKSNWPGDCFHVHEVQKPRGPGNVVMIALDSGNVTEVFTGFGKVGTKAEQIGRAVLKEARRYLAANAPVGEYLADQLLLPMGLAAAQGQVSTFRTVPLSMHSKTQIDVLQMFLDIEISIEDQGEAIRVCVAPNQ